RETEPPPPLPQPRQGRLPRPGPPCRPGPASARSGLQFWRRRQRWLSRYLRGERLAVLREPCPQRDAAERGGPPIRGRGDLVRDRMAPESPECFLRGLGL